MWVACVLQCVCCRGEMGHLICWLCGSMSKQGLSNHQEKHHDAGRWRLFRSQSGRSLKFFVAQLMRRAKADREATGLRGEALLLLLLLLPLLLLLLLLTLMLFPGTACACCCHCSCFCCRRS